MGIKPKTTTGYVDKYVYLSTRISTKLTYFSTLPNPLATIKTSVKYIQNEAVINKMTFIHRPNSMQPATEVNKQEIHISTTPITNTTYLIYSKKYWSGMWKCFI